MQAAPRPLCATSSVQARVHLLLQSDQVPAQSMSGGHSPSPAGHDGDGADEQGAPWPLWATVSVQVDSTHSLLQGPDQEPEQWAHGVAPKSSQPPQPSRTFVLLAQQAHSSTPATDVASCPAIRELSGKRAG